MKRAMLIGVATALVAVPTIALASSPSVTTDPTATAVANTSATVHGTVNPEGLATKYAFQYGTSMLYGHETTLTSISGSTSQPVSATLNSLVPGTLYHFRVIAISTGAGGGTSTGTDGTFTTTGVAPAPQTPPAVTTGTASAINSGGANVSGTVNPNGRATSYYFEFGPTSDYGYQTAPADAGAGIAAVPVTGTLTGLAPSQTYHFRLVAVSDGGTTPGLDAQFNTAGTPSAQKLFGHTGFVSPTGMGGVLVGCIGQTKCQGGLTLSRGGVTFAHRPAFTIGANDGGVVHIQLNSTGRSALNRNHHLRVNVLLTQQGGQTSTGIITLVKFT